MCIYEQFSEKNDQKPKIRNQSAICLRLVLGDFQGTNEKDFAENSLNTEYSMLTAACEDLNSILGAKHMFASDILHNTSVWASFTIPDFLAIEHK